MWSTQSNKWSKIKNMCSFRGKLNGAAKSCACTRKAAITLHTFLFLSALLLLFFLLSIYVTVISSDCAKDSANRHSMLHTPSPAVNTSDSSTSLSLLFICIWRPLPFLFALVSKPSHQFCHKFFFLPRSCIQRVEPDQKKDAFLNTAKPGVEPAK